MNSLLMYGWKHSKAGIKYGLLLSLQKFGLTVIFCLILIRELIIVMISDVDDLRNVFTESISLFCSNSIKDVSANMTVLGVEIHAAYANSDSFIENFI